MTTHTLLFRPSPRPGFPNGDSPVLRKHADTAESFAAFAAHDVTERLLYFENATKLERRLRICAHGLPKTGKHMRVRFEDPEDPPTAADIENTAKKLGWDLGTFVSAAATLVHDEQAPTANRNHLPLSHHLRAGLASLETAARRRSLA